MASRRRTAEDKNTKLLRELAAIPANKQCFDCLQRGPTYINVTIGSFVCTTCSGILRGLTPPHRVKSISMTTFTPEEIEYLKSRGNEYCRYVWLGTFDTNSSSIESEVSDDQRKRDFMIQKYEKKRWHVDPEIAVKKMQSAGTMRHKQEAVHSQNFNSKALPETQPLSRLLGKNTTQLVVQNNQPPPPEAWPHPVSSASAPTISTKSMTQNQGSRSIDLLSELAGDSAAVNSQQGNATANGNFANFETAFNSVEKTGWTSFEDDLDPLSSSVSRTLTLGKDSFSRVVSSYSSTVMPRPLSLPTFAPTNPFKSQPFINSGNTSTPSQSQWPSFAAGSNTVPPPSSMSTSASLDTYPMQTRQTNNLQNSIHAFSPASPPAPNPNSASIVSTQQSNTDRYAALKDLDSLFHQPASTKAPSWTVETTSSGSLFEVPATGEKSGSLYSTAPSNPFSSSNLWSQQPQQAPIHNTYQSANPFQTGSESGLSYTQTASSQAYAPFPIPIVGNSPSDDGVRNQFNTNFSAFPNQIVSSPTNGYGTNQLLFQNGGIVSPTTSSGMWNVPMWSSSHLGQSGGLFTSENKSSMDSAQHSDWIQNPVNPFTVPSSNLGYQVGPKSNCSNPFL
ncbi:arf-GAP domain and FG repeat-containing protein 1 isoform X1 [Parasteatoda tepidariorum]|uniref:arf-GAP domain and FG repeat-containing protein 1 isoform X1 n=1 Tax=Parasteatoda tepidariorum TaxID=114398 RepID=UPI0039BC7128